MKINRLLNDKADKKQIRSAADNLNASVEAFFKDYNMPLDKDVTTALLNLFYNDIKTYTPSMIKEIGDENNGDFTEWVNDAFDKSIFVDKAKMEKWLANPKKLDKDPYMLCR